MRPSTIASRMIRRTDSVAEWPSKRGSAQDTAVGRVAGWVAGRVATDAMVGL
jgi:hypothetical protein